MQQPAHKEKPAKPATAQAKPVAQASNQSPRDLRETLEWLRAQGDLIETYLIERKVAGIANATCNRELDVIRGVLKKAKRWHKFAEDIHPLPVRQTIAPRP